MNNPANFFKNKKVLVTGHTGFKGSWLVQVLLNWGADITGLALKPSTSPNLARILGISNKIRNYFLDIRDFAGVKSVFEKERPEILFHLAAQALVRESYDDPLKTISTNTLGTSHILEAIKETNTVKSAVIITTDKVYENKEWLYPYRENDPLGGHDPYSASKAAADMIIQSYVKSFFHPKDFGKKHGTLIAIARAGNVIGGGDWARDRIVPDLVRAVYENNEKIIIRSPEAIRPWQHVLEPLAGYLALAEKLYRKNRNFVGAWNFGPNDESFIAVEELITRGIAILGRGAYEVRPDSEKHESVLLKLDISKARSLLAWQPRLNLEDNLKFTFDWYKNYYENPTKIVEFTNQQIKSFFYE